MHNTKEEYSPSFEVVETNKQLAALSQIHAAIWLYNIREFECAVTLAGAAEGILPPTSDPHMFSVLKNGPLPRAKFDYNFLLNWLKHPTPPDDISIPLFEAAIIIVRATSKFFTVYRTGSPAMRSFVRWCFEQGHLPPPPELDAISDTPMQRSQLE